MTRMLATIVSISTLMAPIAIHAAVAQAPPATHPATEGVTGTWQGDVTLPMQAPLRIIVRFEEVDGVLGGVISIPAQSVTRLPLDNVSFVDGVVKFSIGAAGANWELTLDESGGVAEGVLKQSGMEFPTKVDRLAEGQEVDAGLKRPQTPKPPFPYQTREVEFQSEADGNKLAGTICLPEGDGRHPAVIFITGSGPQDRDETIFDHKPFLVLADDLARHGVASLRYDDRGVGGSEGDLGQATIETFAGDVRGALKALAAAPEIDPTRIGLIGHSEGGIVAPAVAAGSEDVAFIVLLAGTGVPGGDVLRVQLRAILEASGAEPTTIAEQLAMQKKTLQLIDAPDRAEELRAHIRGAVAKEMPGQSDDRIDAITEAQYQSLTSPWFRSFMKYDPAPALRKVRCPVLALDGSKDVQVLPSQNLPAIRGALEAAGNMDVTIRELPGLNHMFQPCDTGAIAEYVTIQQTMDPRVIEIVRDWVRARAGLGG